MQILDREVDFATDLPQGQGDPAELAALAEDMCGHINAHGDHLTDIQREVFGLVESVVIFVRNRYQGRWLTRSYMATAERTFFWTLADFTAPGVAGPRRPTMYFHDGWHVRQHLVDGPPPNQTEILIDREQEATQAQLEVAEALGCDQPFLDYLGHYAANREAIRQRLSQGVGFLRTVKPHLLVF